MVETYRYEGQNLVCAVDIKTNGPIPFFHDIIEINVLPLDKDFKRAKDLPPLHIKIYPKRHNGKKRPVFSDVPNIFEYDQAFEIFESWFKALNLRQKARIVPLSFTWAEVKPFLDDFFGHDPDAGVSYTDFYFHTSVYKDLKSALFFMKDAMFRKGFFGYEPIHRVFGRSGLRKMMRVLSVPVEPRENYFHTCTDMANTYSKLIEIFPVK
jgi:hypothetical protein